MAQEFVRAKFSALGFTKRKIYKVVGSKGSTLVINNDKGIPIDVSVDSFVPYTPKKRVKRMLKAMNAFGKFLSSGSVIPIIALVIVSSISAGAKEDAKHFEQQMYNEMSRNYTLSQELGIMSNKIESANAEKLYLATKIGNLQRELAAAKAAGVSTGYSLGSFELTAYCACEICCDQYADGITYSGTKVKEGRTIAVGPNIIPIGSTVYIEGLGLRIAEDIGGAIDDKRIDVYFDSHDDALRFGRQTANVTIVEEG